MKTTLQQIRAAGPCGLHLDEDGQRTGYLKLKHYLGKGYGDDAPISLATVLDSNGLDDALWCLRSVKGHEREMRLFAGWCARRVGHLMTDERSLNALNVAERHANGEATDGELAAASAAAWDVAWVAAWDAQATELRRVCACIDAGEDPYPFTGVRSSEGVAT